MHQANTIPALSHCRSGTGQLGTIAITQSPLKLFKLSNSKLFSLLPCLAHSCPRNPNKVSGPCSCLVPPYLLTKPSLSPCGLHGMPCLLFLGTCEGSSSLTTIISIFVCLIIPDLNKSWVPLQQYSYLNFSRSCMLSRKIGVANLEMITYLKCYFLGNSNQVLFLV